MGSRPPDHARPRCPGRVAAHHGVGHVHAAQDARALGANDVAAVVPEPQTLAQALLASGAGAVAMRWRPRGGSAASGPWAPSPRLLPLSACRLDLARDAGSVGRLGVATLAVMYPLIDTDRTELLALAQRRGMTGLRVFGSICRVDARAGQ